MQATEVLDLVSALDDDAVCYWLDGGWGVDALLGEQTRPHSDLDLVLSRTDLDRVVRLLRARGYEVIRDWLPTTVAFRDTDGREVDLHPIDTTPDGGGDQVLHDGTAWHYAPPVEGSIGGRRVRCASAEDQLLMHQGYEPRAVDHADVQRLSQLVGRTPPSPFDATGALDAVDAPDGSTR